jgi:hypothetical protein
MRTPFTIENRWWGYKKIQSGRINAIRLNIDASGREHKGAVRGGDPFTSRAGLRFAESGQTRAEGKGELDPVERKERPHGTNITHNTFPSNCNSL